MPQSDTSIVGLPDVEVLRIDGVQTVQIHARSLTAVGCPFCGGGRLRKKDKFVRTLRHANFGNRPSWLHLQSHKFHCKDCGRYFNQRFPGVGKGRRSTEPFRRQVFLAHHHGISQRTLGHREQLGSATVERWYQELLEVKVRERVNDPCPRILGIDEHFFSRKAGFATTFCDLGKRKVFDVTLGRSEKALEPYLEGLSGKDRVQVVLMDLADHYRSLARKHFPKALIVADRFHVIRLVLQQFVAVWGQLDPEGRKNRGLVSLVRRHPKHLRPDQVLRLQAYLEAHTAFKAVYEFLQKLCRVLRWRSIKQKKARRLVPHFIWLVDQLKSSPFVPLQQLGKTLWASREEIVRMMRFTKTN